MAKIKTKVFASESGWMRDEPFGPIHQTGMPIKNITNIFISLFSRDHVPELLAVSHRGEGKAVLVTSQFSHNLSVSLSNYCSAKNLKLTQVEHACSMPIRTTTYLLNKILLLSSKKILQGTQVTEQVFPCQQSRC